ncbi:lysine-specific demethylase hairless [Grus japonensis]|uniref:Lysine-specific demethylase n=1 Tax=Grus japonensis TaxID=30415 RepID=A0ABC9XSG3_GRUJA
MASNSRMGDTPLRWRRAEDTAQDTRESSEVILPRSAAAELGLPGYQEPGKLSCGTEKGCPWRGSDGCLGPGRELTSGRLGCPYPPAPPCLRDALCRPKDGAELPSLLPPRNGQPKAGWAEPCKERPGPRWAEAVLAPLALYSHAYHRYPLPFPGLDSQCPGTTGKPRAAAGDGAGDPPAFCHCPFLVEAKHSPFLLSSLLPTGPLADPPFGGGPEGPGMMGDGRFAGADWRLGSYSPAWGQPLYLGFPPRCKAALAPFNDCSSSGNKEFYPKKEPGFHPPAKDHAPSQLLGKGQAGQDGDGEGEPAVPALPGAPWRDGRAGGSSAVPAPHARTPPPSSSHSIFLLQPGAAGGCGDPWAGVRPHSADFPPELGPGRPSEPKDERLAYQSLQPGSPPGPGEPNPSPPLTDGHYPPVLAKPELPPACLCTAPSCDGCPGVGCGMLGPFEPTLGIPGSRFPCPPSNHTKLKKTWLTRHSEQSLPRCKVPRRDGGPESAGEGKRSGKRLHGIANGPQGAGLAKRGAKATERMTVACPGDGTESGGDPERRMELGEGDLPSRASPVPREPWCLQSVPCAALPESIPRCYTCAARAVGDSKDEEEEDEDPPESTCRLLHFRRFAFGDGRELSVDGFCTLGEAEGEMLRLEAAGPERGSRSAGSSLCLAKHLLGVLGDPFCEAVCRDRDTWRGAPGGPEGSPEGGPPSLGQPPPRGTVQTATLCDLLASTAVKLCLGQDGVRMAFAPVSPALPTDNRLTSILDSIIARVVERKIQERQAGGELSPPSSPRPPDPPTSHCILASSGLLWLHDPGHASNYKLFQEHWQRGQPVLVSGLQKRLEGRLWGPESFRPAGGEQAVEVVNLRAPTSRVRMSSQEFWDGFAASAASPERGGGDLLKLESGFGDMELCRAANLSASLPLPEYCGSAGRLNLAAYLRGQRGRRWLCPRVCVAYGVHPQDRTIGTKNLTVEAADSISVLVHAAAWLPERLAARQDLLLQADADGMDAPLKERLWDAGSWPGALWHIFRAEDAGRIRDFLQKACEDQGQEGPAAADSPGRYLDLSLRRRLREECGVSGWTLLQFLGDAVLVPAGAPYQSSQPFVYRSPPRIPESSELFPYSPLYTLQSSQPFPYCAPPCLPQSSKPFHYRSPPRLPKPSDPFPYYFPSYMLQSSQPFPSCAPLGVPQSSRPFPFCSPPCITKATELFPCYVPPQPSRPFPSYTPLHIPQSSKPFLSSTSQPLGDPFPHCTFPCTPQSPDPLPHYPLQRRGSLSPRLHVWGVPSPPQNPATP